jgi:hypothetical protein
LGPIERAVPIPAYKKVVASPPPLHSFPPDDGKRSSYRHCVMDTRRWKKSRKTFESSDGGVDKFQDLWDMAPCTLAKCQS